MSQINFNALVWEVIIGSDGISLTFFLAASEGGAKEANKRWGGLLSISNNNNNNDDNKKCCQRPADMQQCSRLNSLQVTEGPWFPQGPPGALRDLQGPSGTPRDPQRPGQLQIRHRASRRLILIPCVTAAPMTPGRSASAGCLPSGADGGGAPRTFREK